MVRAPRAQLTGASRLAARDPAGGAASLRRLLCSPRHSPPLPSLLRCRPDSPSLFFFFFLSFRFLFSDCVPGSSLGGTQAAEQLANSGQDRRRCRFRLLVSGRL